MTENFPTETGFVAYDLEPPRVVIVPVSVPPARVRIAGTTRRLDVYVRLSAHRYGTLLWRWRRGLSADFLAAARRQLAAASTGNRLDV